uniref:Uncharacterized protein n=1 Tax=Lepeophtheirus salmonis TaxID=72036 RepID=A0A0K2UDQ4_LEPSM
MSCYGLLSSRVSFNAHQLVWI